MRSLLARWFCFFQAEDGIRDGRVTGFRRVLFRSLVGRLALPARDRGGRRNPGSTARRRGPARPPVALDPAPPRATASACPARRPGALRVLGHRADGSPAAARTRPAG